MITESQVRQALRDDMMREVVLAANNELEEIKEEVENEDWEDQIALRNRMTTRVALDAERRQGFLMSKEDRTGAKSHPVQHHNDRTDSLFASMYKPAASRKTLSGGKSLNWEFVETLQESLNMLYKSEAVSEVGERHSYLNLIDLKYRKNPDIIKTIQDVGNAMDLVKHKPLLDKTKLTRTDIKLLVKKLKEHVSNQTDLENQKNQVRMLVESLQSFGSGAAEGEEISSDSPLDLLKDMFMHLIQEEKHKYYSPDDWFQLINAMH